MAIIKCKMCGGDLILTEGATTAECEYCGSLQTVPTADNEKKLTLFARANRLRAACEFDKAAGIYENIVADFPEEAEAYWGLVLCKYGIEYVDDPGTGKKIPTCHRSSFDSVMDDENFEQACENADMVAKKVYRDEAKQIEEIRRGILEVSASEKPYDVFICYKETDAHGDRTVDSLIAQDIYDALTTKGYRTFFSRITLEDKLGQAYEPYIFAALNSAKVMLAVGTCYEHYDAVWVKNEWSRYLKIAAKDKNRYLIPCYKGIDAYDIPKEFAHLQGQDMGKVGAIADLVRGVEKLIPKATPTTVIKEKVVVGGSGGTDKVANLLDRGNLALEDGNWDKAISFFEDVLNNDSRNAQAYLGEALAQARCRTIDAFVRKRMAQYGIAQTESLYIDRADSYIEDAANKYSLPGYVTQEEILGLYNYDLSYPSQVSSRVSQYKNEEDYWATDKLLSKAEKFATGEVALALQSEKKQLFAKLSQLTKETEEAEKQAKSAREDKYKDHLAEADEKAEALYNDGLARREKDYDTLLNKAKTLTSMSELLATATAFEALYEYKDSKNLAEHCRKRATEEQAKLDAEAERQRLIREQEAAEKRAKNKKLAIIAGAAAAVVIVAVTILTKVIIPSNNYKKAEALFADGKYQEAIAAFEALGDYKDSAERIEAVNSTIKAEREAEILAQKQAAYKTANYLLEQVDYDGAISAFVDLGSFENSADLCREAKYLKAVELFDNKKYDDAYTVFIEITDYKDTQKYLEGYTLVPTSILYTSSYGGDSSYKFTYNAEGKMVEAVSPKGIGSDRYIFDTKGAVLEEKDASNPLDGYDYEYSEDGKVVRTSGTGQVRYFDKYGNETGVLDRDGKYSELILTYDKQHNRTDDRKNTYDENGNLVSVYYSNKKRQVYAVADIVYENKYCPGADMDLIWKNIRLICHVL